MNKLIGYMVFGLGIMIGLSLYPITFPILFLVAVGKFVQICIEMDNR